MQVAIRTTILLLAGCTFLASAPLIFAQTTPQPNVLFIAVDDLNDWIEPLGGHPQTKTPNLNRLAKRSTVFTNAHCQAPICNPSRVSMLIGKLPSSTGIYYLGPHFRKCESTKHAVSIPQHFAAHGYKTMAAGKIFHAGDKNEFQTYAGNFGGFGPRPKKPIHAGQTHPLWDWGAFPAKTADMPDAKIADWTADQLNREHEKPFFLACGFYRPHVPLYAPEKYFQQFPLDKIILPPHRRDDFDDIPSYARDLSWSAVAPRHQWMLDNQQWNRAVQSYLACVNFVDEQIGRVLDALEKSRYRDNTIIVLWSDHGFHVGTKQSWGKRSLWEDSTRVVLMISSPGFEKPQTCNQPVGLIDVYPTLIDLASLRPRTGLEGHSLVHLLKNPDDRRRYPAVTTFGRYNHSIRNLDYRYTTYADGSEEFYQNSSDPHEFRNLIKSSIASAAKNELRAFLPQLNHPMASGSHNADARPNSPAEIEPDRQRRIQKNKRNQKK